MELAIVAPVVLFVVLAVIQAGLWWHAEHVALAAAQQGLSVAETSGPGAGQSEAQSFAQSLGLDGATSKASGGATVQVQVSGQAPGLLPGLDISVQEQASGRAEHFAGP